MLTIEKKIQAELNRLVRYQYRHITPLDGWSMKRGYYKSPGLYDMLEDEWIPLSPGIQAGKPDLTVFLKNIITLDETYRGENAVLLLKTGGEGCVSVNGAHYNGLDFNRNMIWLTTQSDGNEVYEIEVEAYCKDLILDSEHVFKTNVTITQSEIAAINRPVWDYYFLVKTYFEFTDGCKEEYTRQRAFKIIYDSLLSLNFHDENSLTAGIINAQELLEDGMKQLNDLKLPVTMHFAGHSHIDVAWHWPLKETVRKVSRTYSSMLRLMEQYDNFKFCQSMPALYEMAKEYYPEVFSQVKERIRQGRWETLGSMYVEPDCNLISGESFVRQIMYGKKFYQEELGSDSNICFLPDVFGYSSAMPQILKKAGTDYFFTTKLTWNETNEFPYSVFKWRGLDGTELLSGMMSMCTSKGLGLYNGDLSAPGVRMSLDHFKNKELGDPLLYLYGHGDGGGGVTKEMLESLKTLHKVPWMPEVRIGTVEEYFESLDKEKDYPVWSGELYFEKHRGTYTTAAKNKRNNRKSEFLYRNAEIISVFQYLEHHSYQGESLDAGWKKILLNQFHDTLPGTCIAEVYEDCDVQYEDIQKIGEEHLGTNVNALLAPKEHTVTVFNTLSWERSHVVSIKADGMFSVRDFNGTYPKQVLKQDGTIDFLAEDVPALGYQVYYLSSHNISFDDIAETGCVLDPNRIEIENDWLHVTLNREGELLSVYDRKAKRQILKEGRKGNRIKLLEDIPVEWGAAWETTRKRDDKEPMEAHAISCEIKEHNLLYTQIEVKKHIHQSHITQDILIYHHAPLIEFKTVTDWDEHQKILRVEFPVDIHSLTARYDVAFGNTEHPNHATTSYDEARFEVCGHKWGDVSDGSYGVALLNDCKYGYTIQNSNIELSLLKSADFPSISCDRGVHEYTYWLYPHTGNIREGRVAQCGYEVNVPLLVWKGKASADCTSFFKTDCSNVIIDTVKKAEHNDSIIIRLFETYNTVSDVTLEFACPVLECEETDLLERPLGHMDVTNGTIHFRIQPYEIKTFRFK